MEQVNNKKTNPRRTIHESTITSPKEGYNQVTVTLEDWNGEEYATHLKILRGNEPPFLICGHYFMGYPAALRDYKQRCIDEGVHTNIKELF